jgi:transcription elongation GreA/GreB family factor
MPIHDGKRRWVGSADQSKSNASKPTSTAITAWLRRLNDATENASHAKRLDRQTAMKRDAAIIMVYVLIVYAAVVVAARHTQS